MTAATSSLSRVPPPLCVHGLGVPLHLIDVRGVVERMEQWIARRDGCHWIALTSSHGLVEGYKYRDFREILKSADLSLPDGRWTARLAGWRANCPPHQVRGSDLLQVFCQRSSEKGYRNFFYGDTQEVLTLLTDKLKKGFPGLNVVGTYSPPFRVLTPEEDAAILHRINQARPDALWVGLGLPKQEWWIFTHRERLQVPVVVAAGAAFKFMSGKVKPAPARVRAWGLEWAWRLAKEPRRVAHRALVYGPQFAFHALLELSGLRKYPSGER